MTLHRRNEKKGLIYNIQRFSVHDGPGIRTVIFTKGCQLSCVWCCNPESQNRFQEIAYKKSQCIGIAQCGLCIKECPNAAICEFDAKISIDREKCDNCGKCVEICPANAIIKFGQYVSIEDVLKSIETESNYYWRSGGGITVSGGEPLIQAEFVSELMKVCRERGIHTAIETCGCFELNDKYTNTALAHTNQIYYDIKYIDPTKHKAYTGIDNRRILENLSALSDRFPETTLIVRTPIIPKLNDDEENIRAIAYYIKELKNLHRWELLPYHAFGAAKYEQLGRKYLLKKVRPPRVSRIAHLKNIAKNEISNEKIEIASSQD